MSIGTLDGERQGTVDAILAKFGASIGQAEQNAAGKTTDPGMKRLMAARMALEYAVLATAREKHVSTEIVGAALARVPVAQQTVMLQNGTAALGRAYGVEPELLLSAFAGRISDVEMPKGLGSTPEIEKMVDHCRNLVTGIVKDEYAHRGVMTGVAGGKADAFLSMKSDGIVAPAKVQLAARMAFMDASIDAAVGKGLISKVNAEWLKERVELQVFQPRPPQSLQYSEQFKSFFEQRGKDIRAEAMKEVRGVTQSSTMQEIAAKLKLVLPPASRTDRPADHRSLNTLER